MKCKDCPACKRGWFDYSSTDYICTGVKEPFAIKDINAECTEYLNNMFITPENSDKPIKIAYEPGEYDWKMIDNKDGTVTFSKKITIEELVNLIKKG